MARDVEKHLDFTRHLRELFLCIKPEAVLFSPLPHPSVTSLHFLLSCFFSVVFFFSIFLVKPVTHLHNSLPLPNPVEKSPVFRELSHAGYLIMS